MLILDATMEEQDIKVADNKSISPKKCNHKPRRVAQVEEERKFESGR